MKVMVSIKFHCHTDDDECLADMRVFMKTENLLHFLSEKNSKGLCLSDLQPDMVSDQQLDFTIMVPDDETHIKPLATTKNKRKGGLQA